MKEKPGSKHPFISGVMNGLAGIAWPYFLYKSSDVTNKDEVKQE